MQKKIVLVVAILVILFALIMYLRYMSGYIIFGFEDIDATSARQDEHFQVLPKWEYKILKDGKVYYRETDGCVTNSRIEYWVNQLIYIFGFSSVKKLDENTIEQVKECINANISNDTDVSSKTSSEDFQSEFLNSQYYIKVKENYKWTTFKGKSTVDTIKSIMGEDIIIVDDKK